MTSPTTPAATPERVSDETLQQMAWCHGMSNDYGRAVNELIARRKAGSAVEAYDDVLRIIRERGRSLHGEVASLMSREDLNRYDENIFLEQLIQRRRDAAGGGT